MTDRWMERCPCGHPWAAHDVEEHSGDGTETCCVEGCRQLGCPGRAPRPDVAPTNPGVPAGRCDYPSHGIERYSLVDAGAQRVLIVCPSCDSIPAGGWPVREPGWARRQYEDRQRQVE